jgi:hypothetical protein
VKFARCNEKGFLDLLLSDYSYVKYFVFEKFF